MGVSASFVLFALIASITPGPNNIMIMTSGLNFGVRASLPHYLGICLGVPGMMLAIGFGLGFFFERYVSLFLLLKLFGVAYLLYLAWRTAWALPSGLSQSPSSSQPLSFVQAALFQWVNPKAIIIGSSAFATYTSLDQNVNWQIMTIVFVMFIATLLSVGIWMFFGASLKYILTKPRHQRMFNVTMALLLVVAIWPVIQELINKAVFSA